MLDEKSNTALITNLIIFLLFMFTETNEVSVSIFDKTNEFVRMNICLNLGTVNTKISNNYILLRTLTIRI
jgi:hypothetical protein